MKKVIYVILILALLFSAKKSFSQGYSQLGEKYHLTLLDFHEKEMKSEVLIPGNNQKSIREFLTILDEYNSSKDENAFLQKINPVLLTFSNYTVKIDSPLSSKDPVKDKILLLYEEKEVVTTNGNRIKIHNSYAIFKIKSKWTITGICHNYVENYRNISSAVGYIDPSGSFITTNGSGGEFIYILEIFKGSKGSWE